MECISILSVFQIEVPYQIDDEQKFPSLGVIFSLYEGLL